MELNYFCHLHLINSRAIYLSVAYKNCPRRNSLHCCWGELTRCDRRTDTSCKSERSIVRPLQRSLAWHGTNHDLRRCTLCVSSTTRLCPIIHAGSKEIDSHLEIARNSFLPNQSTTQPSMLLQSQPTTFVVSGDDLRSELICLSTIDHPLTALSVCLSL